MSLDRIDVCFIIRGPVVRNGIFSIGRGCGAITVGKIVDNQLDRLTGTRGFDEIRDLRNFISSVPRSISAESRCREEHTTDIQ